MGGHGVAWHAARERSRELGEANKLIKTRRRFFAAGVADAGVDAGAGAGG